VRSQLIPLILVALIIISGLAPTIIVAGQKEVLIVAQLKYIKNPNPMREETWYDWWLNLVTYDRLFRIGPDLEPKPWLCEYYEMSEDGLTWAFKIVKGAKWHDGVPLTAKDIAFTIEFYKKYKPPAWYPSVEYIEEVKVLDDYTFIIKLSKTFVWITRRFGTIIILPEHIWKHVPEVFEDPTKFNPLNSEHVEKVLKVIKEKEPPEIASKVEEFVKKYGHLRIGSGPFMLVRWKEGELLEMEKFPDYYKKGFPRVDVLIYKVYAKPDAQYLAVKKGEVHFMVWTVPYAVIKEAVKDPNIVLPKAPDTYIGFIGINMKDPILKNKLVRKAIAHAIDKKKIVDLLMLGFAEPVYTFIHPGYKKWVNWEVPKYKFNLDKAAKLLDEAGFKDIDGDGIRETPDGKDLELTILTPSYDPVRVRIGDLMVEWFKKIGIKLTNRPVDFDTLIDLVYNKFEFQLYIIENDAQFEPWYLSSYYVKEQHVPGGNNPWGFINDEFEKLVRKADTEVNEEERIKIVHKLQEILADELPLIPLYVRYWMQAYRADLSGVVEMPGGALNFWTLINANFRGIKPELPYTKIVPPPTPILTTPTTPPPTTPTSSPTPTATPTVITTTVTVTETKTVTSTITTTSPTTITTTVTEVPAALMGGIAVLVIIIIALLALMFLRRR